MVNEPRIIFEQAKVIACEHTKPLIFIPRKVCFVMKTKEGPSLASVVPNKEERNSLLT